MADSKLLKWDVSPPEHDGYAQDKDAKSLNSSAIHATENDVSRRPARSGGRDFAFQQPPSDAVVCDASVFIAVAFAEPGSVTARALTRSRRLFAPPLLRYEVAHVALRKSGCEPGEAAQVEEAFRRSLRVPFRGVEPSWPAVIELAREHGLSAYDASYLQIAQALRIPLATLDERLARAAQALGLLATPVEPRGG
jgi:predicted nucleic acid-binding protein